MRNDVDERQECESCGGDHHLMLVDGLILCQTCRDTYYRKEYPELYANFIDADEIDRHNFLTNFVFSVLPAQAQDRIVSKYLEEARELCPTIYYSFFNGLCKDYVDEYHDEFTDWMDKSQGAKAVRQ